MTRDITSIRLRALQGTPLADPAVRNMVIAAARALGERHGVDVLRVDAGPDQITCTILADRIVAMGFAAELRRSTSAWYEHKFGVSDMWGEAVAESGTESDWTGERGDEGSSDREDGDGGPQGSPSA